MNSVRLLVFLVVLVGSGFAGAAEFQATSPDGDITVTVRAGEDITWSAACMGRVIMEPSPIALHTDRGDFGVDPVIVVHSRQQVREALEPVVAEKRSRIKNHYNKLVLEFKDDYSLEFRVFDDGAAYRFVTRCEGPLIVEKEQIEFHFAGDPHIYFPEEDRMITHQERLYLYEKLAEIEPDRFCSIPALVDIRNGPKVAITESDLFDYPGFYLFGTSSARLEAKFPHYVLEESMRGDRTPVIEKRADYIAKTDGSRSFPWRVLAIAKEDAGLVDCQIVWKLARPCQIADPSWIRPGKVAWDWYNANNIYGVDFRAGVNTATYKYYIDFASRYGIEYVILDEGWYKLGDLLDVNPNMDLEELFRYAEQKNVGIILWVVWKTLEDQMDEALDQFAAWGCKGIKVDFMQRDDQWMVNYYERVAREAAKRQMLVDFHGSYKPAGLRRAWPNVMTREGVKGAENNKWTDQVTPDHNLTLPFIRMLAGPMDYTPGAMINAKEKNFRAIFTRPMSQGTRCHQLAMYVVFESPLQMLCENPSHYYREPECMRFLAIVPTVWDETVVLDGKIGDYVALARQSGEHWFVGAMTDWEKREMTIDFSFLPGGRYTATIWQDGPNAHRYASDFQMIEKTVSSGDKMRISLAPGGGWAARLRPMNSEP